MASGWCPGQRHSSRIPLVTGEDGTGTEGWSQGPVRTCSWPEACGGDIPQPECQAPVLVTTGHPVSTDLSGKSRVRAHQSSSPQPALPSTEGPAPGPLGCWGQLAGGREEDKRGGRERTGAAVTLSRQQSPGLSELTARRSCN